MHRSVLSLLLTAALTAAASAQTTYFTASLDGDQVVPASGSTESGWAVVRLVLPAGVAQVSVFGLPQSATGASLRVAGSGANGPVAIALMPNPLAAGFHSGTGSLPAATVTALQSEGCYVEVTTSANPGGAIRGQVVSPRSIAFTASIDAAQAVPPSSSTITGEAFLWLHEPDNRLVYQVLALGFGGGVPTELRMAPAGSNGPLVATLVGSGGVNDGVTDKLTPAQVQALHAGDMYLALPTASFPNGEVRGQVRPGPHHLIAAMDGAQEVPPVTTAAFGQACITINPDGSLTYLLNASGVVGTAAHLHRGAAGVNGPIVVPLTALTSSLWMGTSSPLTPSELAELRAGMWYANVHSSAFPGGEIRGQVLAGTLPATFGGGCTNFNGGRAEIGTRGVACLGDTLTVTVDGSTIGSFAMLALGFNRDTVAGLPLPLPLSALQLQTPGCFGFHDVVVTLGAVIQSNGSSFTGISVPFRPTLRGLHLYGQWYVFDRTSNPLGLVTSNAIDITLQ